MASLKSASSGASRRASASSRCERRRWRSAVRRRSRSASSGADAGSAMLARPLPSSASLCRPRLGFSRLHAPLTHSGLRSPAPAPAPATGLVRAAPSTQLGRQLKATRAPPGRGVGCGGVRRCCGGLWHTSRRERTARARSAAHARGSDTRVLAAKASASPESHGAGSGVNARARPGREGEGRLLRSGGRAAADIHALGAAAGLSRLSFPPRTPWSASEGPAQPPQSRPHRMRPARAAREASGAITNAAHYPTRRSAVRAGRSPRSTRACHGHPPHCHSGTLLMMFSSSSLSTLSMRP